MRNVLIDAVLFALFVAELSFRYLPGILHEIFGVAMAALIIWHIVMNRRRVRFMLTLNIALTICSVLILATGICISNHLFADAMSLEIQRKPMIHSLHVAIPYIMLILIGVHIGLNWHEFWNRLLHLIGAKEFYKRRKKFFIAAAIMLSSVGVVGLFMNRVRDRILMKHIFATPATDLPVVVFMLMIIGGVALFATITFFAKEKIFRKGRG